MAFSVLGKHSGSMKAVDSARMTMLRSVHQTCGRSQRADAAAAERNRLTRLGAPGSGHRPALWQRLSQLHLHLAWVEQRCAAAQPP